MRFTIVGGDLRSVHLCHRLRRDGHEVRCFGLELGDIPASCKADSPEAALRDSQCVVLPIPASSGSLLRTPYSACPLPLDTLSRALPHGIPVFGGGSCPIPMTDLTRIESMAVGNAALTAQAAVLLILQNTRQSLMGQRVLIIGGGRIGTLLGLQLKALGAEVTIASRRDDCKAWHRAMGMKAADVGALWEILPLQDVTVNTVPAPVLHREALRQLPRHALLMELASLPGGFDPVLAEALGIQTIIGRGLPGTYTPAGAADLIAETIYQELEM